MGGILQREGRTGLTVEDTEVFGNGKQRTQFGILNQGKMITIRRVDIHTISNGISTDQGLIEDSYVHDPKYFKDDHTDMIMSTGSAAPRHRTDHQEQHRDQHARPDRRDRPLSGLRGGEERHGRGQPAGGRRLDVVRGRGGQGHVVERQGDRERLQPEGVAQGRCGRAGCVLG
ncbi:hypothetical protein [Nonomuraea salmonea]|uniref:hypothetical protein n=1 Tax=Nonomuraea salmonea TaxID=46181 RepID=UPI0031E6360B